MSRTIEIAMQPDKRRPFLERIGRIEGIAGISVLAGGSTRPPGDIVTVKACNEAAEQVLDAVDALGILDGGSFTLSEPAAMVAPAQQRALQHETNEAPWEEMQSLFRRNTNLSINYLALMLLSGAVAGIGLLQDKLHLVIGSMLVCPGFEPLVRMNFGLWTGHHREALKGLLSVSVGYGLLALGGALGCLIVLTFDAATVARLSTLEWLAYWTSGGWYAVGIATLAGIAGTLVVNSHRTVFGAGVMVLVGLIPSMAAVGLGLAAGEPAVALMGLARWSLDAACVLAGSFFAMGWKRLVVHRRRPVY